MVRPGAALSLTNARMTADRLTGHSAVLGDCELPADKIRELILGGYGQRDATRAYADWRPINTIEPVFPGGASADDPSAEGGGGK